MHVGIFLALLPPRPSGHTGRDTAGPSQRPEGARDASAAAGAVRGRRELLRAPDSRPVAATAFGHPGFREPLAPAPVNADVWRA